MTARGSVWPLWAHVNCTLTMSTCLSTIQPLLQQTTNIWKIPPQTDVTCSGVLLQLCSRPSILLISSTIRCSCGWSLLLLFQKATKERTEENCSTAASQSGWLHLRSIERARYATKHVRDTDSDYVMKKPSRCWLGAVPRYWKVVASCFQNVSFAENTSSPLAPRARIFQPILLLFFFVVVFLLLNLSTKPCLRLHRSAIKLDFSTPHNFKFFFFGCCFSLVKFKNALNFLPLQSRKPSVRKPAVDVLALQDEEAPLEEIQHEPLQTIIIRYRKRSLCRFFFVCVIASFHQDASQFGQS